MNNYTYVVLFSKGEYNPLNVTKQLLEEWHDFLGANSVTVDNGNIVALMPKSSMSRVDKLIEQYQNKQSQQVPVIPALRDSETPEPVLQAVLLPAGAFDVSMVTEEWCKEQAQKLGAVRVFLEHGHLKATLPVSAISGTAELLSNLAVNSVGFACGARITHALLADPEYVRADGTFIPERLVLPDFFTEVTEEMKRARELFPNPNKLTLAFVEEAGELVKAIMDLEQRKSTPEEIRKEAVQVCAMVLRLLTEGDPVVNLQKIM